MRYRSSDNRDLSLPLKQVCGMDNVHGNDLFFPFLFIKRFDRISLASNQSKLHPHSIPSLVQHLLRIISRLIYYICFIIYRVTTFKHCYIIPI